MKKSDLLLILLTFILGLCVGAYLFVAVYAPTKEQAVRERNADQWEVRGESFGGCDMTGAPCATFFFSSTGQAAYSEDESTVYERELGRSLRQDVRQALEAADWTEYGRPGGVCRAASDGVDYEFTVSFDGSREVLNTCGTRFSDTELAIALEAAVETLASDSSSESPAFFEAGLSEWLESELDRRFEYDE